MERPIDDLMREFNDRAKAEGRFLDKDPWDITRTPGSILDVSETPESRRRIASLRRRIAELEQEAARKREISVQALQQETREATQSQITDEPARAG